MVNKMYAKIYMTYYFDRGEMTIYYYLNGKREYILHPNVQMINSVDEYMDIFENNIKYYMNYKIVILN
jgi:hypothetical protein